MTELIEKRCETCRYWEPPPPVLRYGVSAGVDTHGTCTILSEGGLLKAEPLAYCEDYLHTNADFGCVQHEAKPEFKATCKTCEVSFSFNPSDRIDYCPETGNLLIDVTTASTVGREFVHAMTD